jgi:hypothetical protein
MEEDVSRTATVSRRGKTRGISKVKPVLHLSKIGGKTLEDYKEWVLGVCKDLGAKEDEPMTEEQWVRDWKEFWDGADPPVRDGQR